MNVLENVLETSASLATHFKVDARTIRRDLSVLQTKGFIRHDGPDKGGRWVVIKGKLSVSSERLLVLLILLNNMPKMVCEQK